MGGEEDEDDWINFISTFSANMAPQPWELVIHDPYNINRTFWFFLVWQIMLAWSLISSVI